MKTTFLITLLFCVTNLFAQTNFYTTTKIFNEGNYSYQCNVSSVGNVTLYNTSNSWIGMDQKNKTTNQTFMNEDICLSLITDGSWEQSRTEFRQIMIDAVSDMDREILQIHGNLYVNFYINPETGRVADVRFYFDRNTCYAYFPISFFRNLELSIKERCQYVVTDFAGNLNFVYLWDTFKL